jgi:hypothetical protein
LHRSQPVEAAQGLLLIHCTKPLGNQKIVAGPECKVADILPPQFQLDNIRGYVVISDSSQVTFYSEL